MACRSSAISSSDIRVRAQWTAPAPIVKRATPRVSPREKLSALTWPNGQMNTILSTGKITYEAMKPMVASMDSTNRNATVRSERFAARSSMSWMRGRW